MSDFQHILILVLLVWCHEEKHKTPSHKVGWEVSYASPQRSPIMSGPHNAQIPAHTHTPVFLQPLSPLPKWIYYLRCILSGSSLM